MKILLAIAAALVVSCASPSPSPAPAQCNGVECWIEPHSGVCDAGACVCRSNNDCDPHNLKPCMDYQCANGNCAGVPFKEGAACSTPTLLKGTCVAGDCAPLL